LGSTRRQQNSTAAVSASPVTRAHFFELKHRTCFSIKRRRAREANLLLYAAFIIAGIICRSIDPPADTYKQLSPNSITSICCGFVNINICTTNPSNGVWALTLLDWKFRAYLRKIGWFSRFMSISVAVGDR